MRVSRSEALELVKLLANHVDDRIDEGSSTKERILTRFLLRAEKFLIDGPDLKVGSTGHSLPTVDLVRLKRIRTDQGSAEFDVRLPNKGIDLIVDGFAEIGPVVSLHREGVDRLFIVGENGTNRTLTGVKFTQEWRKLILPARKIRKVGVK